MSPLGPNQLMVTIWSTSSGVIVAKHNNLMSLLSKICPVVLTLDVTRGEGTTLYEQKI